MDVNLPGHEQSQRTVAPATYDADDASTILNIPKPSLYEHARRDPDRFGVLRFGRSLRFRKAIIDEIVGGASHRVGA